MKILVIGAGVAGLFFASFMGKADVTVLEKNEFAGRKLLATGNGRCNFTNLNQGYDYYTSENRDFIKAIDYFTEKDLIEFFEKIGMTSTSLPSGRCYPETMSSKTVRDVLFLDASESTNFIFNEEVVAINFDKKTVKTTNKTYPYDKLVIATGGKSLKNSGSDGKIFDLISKNIPLTQMTYGITNFETKQKLSKLAKGTKITGKASLIVDDKVIKSSTDDIIFQDYGLTGTDILDIANELAISLQNKSKCTIEIDMLTSFTEGNLLDFLEKMARTYPNRVISELLVGIINEKLVNDVIKIAKINQKKKVADLNEIDYQMLVKTLKHLRFDVTKIHDIENAQVTIGGVDTRYVNPRTMQSEIYPDVHFIGEVLDVAGACGGYNIQWAATSAKICADFLKE